MTYLPRQLRRSPNRDSLARDVPTLTSPAAAPLTQAAYDEIGRALDGGADLDELLARLDLAGVLNAIMEPIGAGLRQELPELIREMRVGDVAIARELARRFHRRVLLEAVA